MNNEKEYIDLRKFRTFIGESMFEKGFDVLRAWVNSPFTLTNIEAMAYKQFVKLHSRGKRTEFDWFFEVYWRRDCELSQNEINGLLKTIDDMEEQHREDEIVYLTKYECYLENHAYYLSRLFDDPKDLEFFEVFSDQRNSKIRVSIDYRPEHFAIKPRLCSKCGKGMLHPKPDGFAEEDELYFLCDMCGYRTI